jgi:hypothetical protein
MDKNEIEWKTKKKAMDPEKPTGKPKEGEKDSAKKKDPEEPEDKYFCCT